MSGRSVDFPDLAPQTYAVAAGEGGAESNEAVIVRKIGDQWMKGVNPDYFLQQPIVAGSTPVECAVAGKLSSTADDATGWSPTFPNDQTWIEGDVIEDGTGLLCTNAMVQSYGQEGSEGGGCVENDGGETPKQSKCRIFLGETVSDGAGGLRFRPHAGKFHRFGYAYVDSKDASGGTPAQIDALVAAGM